MQISIVLLISVFAIIFLNCSINIVELGISRQHIEIHLTSSLILICLKLYIVFHAYHKEA